MNMVLQGISMMCAKRSPALMRETLKSFVAHYENEIFDGRPTGSSRPPAGATPPPKP
jgi:chemotaxis protein MotA